MSKAAKKNARKKAATKAAKAAARAEAGEPEDTPTPGNGEPEKMSKTKKKRLNREAKESNKEKTKYQASINELSRLGQAIADSRVKVPQSVLDIARRAIQLRKDVSRYFMGRKWSTFHSNRTHKHFVDRLEEICDVLERNSFDDKKTEEEEEITGEKKKKKKKKGVGPATQAWLNRFAALTVEDTENLPEDESEKLDIIKAEAVEEEERKRKPKRNMFGEVEDDSDYLSQHFFRVFCMFHDLQNWRKFLTQTWEEYRDGKTDLMSASIVTDSALQLAKDLVEDTLASLPREIRGETLELQNQLYFSACRLRGVNPAPSGVRASGGGDAIPFNAAMGEVVDWCYMDMATLLSSFVPQLDDTTIPVYRPGFGGYYDPKADRSKMSVAQKFNEDKVLMLELFPEFCKIQSFGVKIPVRDEVTAGFVDFISSKKASLRLCFALRIMLDAQHILRHTEGGALADLKTSSSNIDKTITEYLELSKTHPQPAFWDASGDQSIKHVQETIQVFVEYDVFKQFTKTGERILGRKRRGDNEHLLFRRNPILSGLLQFQLHLRMQTIGQNLVSQWYDVPQLAFLYNLAEKTTTKPLPWPDMDLFIKIHGEARIFVGDRPKDAEQSLNRLELATGISSAARFAKNSRHRDTDFHRPDMRGQNARRLKPTTKAVNIFRARYIGDWSPETSRTRSISGPDVEHLLTELLKTSDKVEPKTKQSALTKKEHRLERKWQKTHDIGSLQLLALIKHQLYEEEPILKFNYFGMHKRSVELLRLIRDKEHQKFVQYFTEGYMPNDSFISNIVLLILHVARGGGRAKEELGGMMDSVQTVSGMVIRCWGIMKEWLEEKGDVGCKELRAVCKNQRVLDREIGEGEKGRDWEAEGRLLYWIELEDVIGTAQMESLRYGIPLAD